MTLGLTMVVTVKANVDAMSHEKRDPSDENNIPFKISNSDICHDYITCTKLQNRSSMEEEITALGM